MLKRWRVDHRLWLPLLAVLALAAGGCENKLKTERDRLHQQNEELQSELESTRQALEEAESDRARLVEKVAELEGEKANLQSELKNSPFNQIEGVEVSAGKGRITVRVPGDVLFDPGKISIKSPAKKTLNEVAGVLNSEYADKTIRVEGYTDTDPIRKSDWDDNIELSSQRAMAVERYLMEQGIDGERMYSAGFGAAKPRGTKAKSRRVEIVVEMR